MGRFSFGGAAEDLECHGRSQPIKTTCATSTKYSANRVHCKISSKLNFETNFLLELCSKSLNCNFDFQQRQPSLGDQGWNEYDQQPPPNQGGYYAPTQPLDHDKQTVINYGATQTNSNPFHSSNPFASDVSTSMVQPATRDDYSHDPVQNQSWN